MEAVCWCSCPPHHLMICLKGGNSPRCFPSFRDASWGRKDTGWVASILTDPGVSRRAPRPAHCFQSGAGW